MSQGLFAGVCVQVSQKGWTAGLERCLVSSCIGECWYSWGGDRYSWRARYLLGNCAGSALEYMEAASCREGATVTHLADEYRLAKGWCRKEQLQPGILCCFLLTGNDSALKTGYVCNPVSGTPQRGKRNAISDERRCLS